MLRQAQPHRGRIIGQASADSAIAAYPQQFVREKSGVVALRDEDDALTEITETVSLPSRPRRARLRPRTA